MPQACRVELGSTLKVPQAALTGTIELNGPSTVWDMSQACLRHIWKPGISYMEMQGTGT